VSASCLLSNFSAKKKHNKGLSFSAFSTLSSVRASLQSYEEEEKLLLLLREEKRFTFAAFLVLFLVAFRWKVFITSMERSLSQFGASSASKITSSSSSSSCAVRAAAANSRAQRIGKGATKTTTRTTRTGLGAVVKMMATTETDRMTIKTHHYDQLSKEEQKLLLKRPRVDFTSIASIVDPIVNKVRDEGDSAVLEFTEKFDKVRPSPLVEKIENFPQPSLDPTVKEAFDVAFENIKKFHEAQLNTGEVDVTTMPGVRCRRVARPIGSVGLYVPGGTAVLPSTALMLAVPAMIAKCPIVVLATPPLKDGTICPEVLYCAKKSGVTHILKAGGAQAVAAMGYGTETCPKVDKIFGPGNQFVTAAKMNLQNSDAMCAIDMPAGPSEVLVVADKDANPSHVAADLLSQAEHGPDSQVVLVVTPDVNVERIVEEVRVQANKLPRADITEKALSHSYCVVVKDMDEVVKFSNAYAPEHLIVNVEDPESLLPSLDNAGSIFMGRYTPESVGDYASGTNHVLPTYGFSRMYSGVSLDSFIKYMTVQELTKEGIENLGPHVAKMAEVEGLDAHRLAVTLRLGIE